MSLEQALAENTAAVKEHTAALKAFVSKGTGTAAASGTSTTAKPSTAKPSTAKGKVTEEALRKAATEFLGTQDADERENRKEWVGKINEHFGVPKISEAPADKWADIVRMLKQLSAGETPPELATEDAGGGDDGDSMI